MALAGHGVRATARPALHPRAFSAPEAFDAEVEALVAVLEEVRPQVVVSYAEDGGYGHPDHVRAHEITVAAVAEVPARLLYAVVGRGTLDAGLAALGADPVPDARGRRAAQRARRGRHHPAGRARPARRAGSRPCGRTPRRSSSRRTSGRSR